VSSASTAFPDAIPVLTDGVVTLRELRPEDSEAVARYSSDPEIGRWMTVPQPYTWDDAEDRRRLAAAAWAAGERYQFAVETGGQLAGGLNLRPSSDGLAEIGYALDATHRGQGVMSRALRLALTWGFEEAGIEVVHWRAQVGNWASRRVAWAVGFRVLEGPIAGLLDYQGGRVDGWLGTLRRGDRLEPAHPWREPERLTGRSVVLRGHREQDVPRMIEACRDPETTHWLSQIPLDYGEPEARQHLEQIRARHAAGQAVYWVAADPEDDRLLAEIGLFTLNPRDPQGEIGYWCHPDARGRGVTTQSVRLAVRHGLLPAEDGGLGLHRMVLRASSENIASQRVAEKAGFTRAGCDRSAYRMRDGSWHDDTRFDLLADELPSVR
jgi:ribosomal-protein-alanine N-acetyltransferase